MGEAALSRPGSSGQQAGNLRMAELARIAGVSAATVSRALAGSPLVAAETRLRIKALAQEQGYLVNPVARSLRSARTGTIGVVVPLFHAADQPLDDPFFSAMLGGLAQALTARGLELLLAKVWAEQPGWVDRLVRERRADAVIIIGQSTQSAAIDAAARAGAPVVVWGEAGTGGACPTVGSDNVEGGRLAAAHLLAGGRRRLAFLGNPALPEIGARLAGFQAAHAAAGVAPVPGHVVEVGFTAADAHAGAAALFARDRAVDGIVASSDLIAAAAVRAALETGRQVPADVAVIGFDDAPIAALVHPALTTVAQDVGRAAEALVDMAIARAAGAAAAGPDVPADVRLGVRLVVRQSA
jgi:DNA-binding LacI/PurR family transcriptional regulator